MTLQSPLLWTLGFLVLERLWCHRQHAVMRRTMDEFAVAMHLISRRLVGDPVPSLLPPSLSPPFNWEVRPWCWVPVQMNKPSHFYSHVYALAGGEGCD